MKKFVFLSTLSLLLTTATVTAQTADSTQSKVTTTTTQVDPTKAKVSKTTTQATSTPKQVASIEVQANNNRADITVTSTMDDRDDYTIDSAHIISNINTAQQLFGDSDISDMIKQAAGGIGVALLTIFGIFFMPFIAIILIIFIVYNNNRKKQKAKYELLQHAIEKGVQIPAELLNDVKAMSKPKLEKGIEQMGLGFGLGLFLWFWTSEIGLAAVGAIIFFIGVGKVVNHYLSKQEQPASTGETTAKESPTEQSATGETPDQRTTIKIDPTDSTK